jgi:hypothetical protein
MSSHQSWCLGQIRLLAHLLAERLQDKPFVNSLCGGRRFGQQTAQFFDAPNYLCLLD